MWAVSAGAQASPPTAPWEDYEAAKYATVEEISSTGAESRLRVRFDPPTTDRLPTRAVKMIWLAGPPGDKVVVSMHSLTWKVAAADGTTTGPLQLNETSGTVTSQPLREIRPRMVDQFRGVAMYRTEIPLSATQSVVGPSGQTNQRTIVMEALIDVKFEGLAEEPLSPSINESDPWGLSVLTKMVSNPGQIPTAAVATEPRYNTAELEKWNTMLADAEKRAPLLFARLTRGGLYALTGDQLSAAGWDAGAVPADRIRLFAGGDELTALPVGIARNRLLTAKEKLVFHVPEDRAGLEPYIPLWVMVGDGPAPRSALVPPPARVRAGQTETATAELRRMIFEPNEYHHDQALTAPQLRWTTATVAPGTFRSFEFQSRRAVAGEEATIEVYASNSSRDVARIDVLVNGTTVGSLTPAPMRVDSMGLSFSTGLLRDGTNTLTISNPQPAEGDKAGPVRFLQAELRIPVETTGADPNQAMVLRRDAPSSITLTLHKYAGMPRTTLAVDVTEPLAPRFHELQSMQLATQSRYEGDVDFPRARPTLIHAPADMARLVPPLEKVPAPRVFLSAEPVDYLAIVHPTLEEALGPLLERRRRDEIVESVTSEEIYRAYSHGRVSFEAIGNCIESVYHRRGGAKLRSVLLVGEASESWWEYRFPSEKVEKNLLPVYGWRDRTDRLRSDDGYATFSGRGAIPDVELARISARTPAQLAGVVAKIARYEEGGMAGEWLNRNVFIMDDEPEFLRVAKRIVGKTFQGGQIPRFLALQDFVYENYLRGIWRKRSVVMTDAIVDAFNTGAFTVTYLGHGGPNLWSEERIFHIRDIDRTANGGNYPILLAGSCDTGWLDYPVEPVNTSLSEHFLRSPNGGAVAAYVPLGATSSYEHDFILSGFYRALIERRVNRLGELALMSKMDYYLDRSNESVTQQYALMGDPGMPIPRPEEMPEAGVLPARLLSATGGRLKVGGVATGVTWGAGSATLLSPGGLPLGDARFSVRNGLFEEIIAIPAHLDPGAYTVVLTASNVGASRFFSKSVPLPVSPVNVRIE